MKAIKKVLNNIFIDGLSGMALGLFSTLIIGTILKQIGDLMGGTYGTYLSAFAVVAQRLTGAGIGIGVAYCGCICGNYDWEAGCRKNKTGSSYYTSNHHPFRWCCRDTGRTGSIKLHDMAWQPGKLGN